ncbi:hypothetical protein FRC17_007103 [Serendipita sp. 399]|nr:hypothetical protein FRC17_007103 [Serendipita sp. 399]
MSRPTSKWYMASLPPSSSPAPSFAGSSPSSAKAARVTDPFAAITTSKGVEWLPPSEALGSKKRNRSPAPSPFSSPVHRKRQRFDDDYYATSSPFGTRLLPASSSPVTGSIPDIAVTPPSHNRHLYASAVSRSPWKESAYEKEETLWGNAISQLVDDVRENGIDLSDRGLTFISSDVANLAKIVRLAPFGPASPSVSRSASLPTTASPGPARGIQRVSTTAISMSNHAKPGMTPVQLFLSGNFISKLPAELFRVENLTVLSLRKNRLTYIPPAIGALRNLEELAIGGNEITFLPSEIEKLPIKALNLHPNKWLECPDVDGPKGSVLSATDSKFTIPSLPELCVRVLLSFPSGSSRTVMDDLEVSTSTDVPHHYLKYFQGTCKTHAAIDPPQLEASLLMDPGAPRRRPEETDPKYDLAYSVCPNRLHGIGVRHTFIRPAEIRYRWVTSIGSADTGGRVPLQYRGCERGCLDFLEEMYPDEEADSNVAGDDDFEF